jgi:hypothetical protein
MTTQIHIRFKNSQEQKQIARLAKDAGLSISNYFRKCAGLNRWRTAASGARKPVQQRVDSIAHFQRRKTVKKHFVTFYSPGSFMAETTTEPIESWHVGKAVEMAKGVVERYNAKPYGFQFSTRERGDDELDSRVTKRSAMYYLGGTILTLQEVKDRKDPKDGILISNMECNGWERVIENCNSWKVVQPLKSEDVILDVTF